jgi:hypothetical protein
LELNASLTFKPVACFFVGRSIFRERGERCAALKGAAAQRFAEGNRIKKATRPLLRLLAGSAHIFRPRGTETRPDVLPATPSKVIARGGFDHAMIFVKILVFLCHKSNFGRNYSIWQF